MTALPLRPPGDHDRPATAGAAVGTRACRHWSGPTTTCGIRRTSPAARCARISCRHNSRPIPWSTPRARRRPRGTSPTPARRASTSSPSTGGPTTRATRREDYQHADAAMKDFLAAPNISQMRFAMFYETWNLGFDPGRESTPVTFQMELHFDSDMVSFAKHYFHNRSYLRIDGRPGRLLVPDPDPHRRRGGHDQRRAQGARGAWVQPLLHRGRDLLAGDAGGPQSGRPAPHHDATGHPH